MLMQSEIHDENHDETDDEEHGKARLHLGCTESPGIETARVETLPSSRSLATGIPRSFAARALVEGTRAKVRRILHGEDRRRMLVVVGPCSIHSAEDALEYARRLRGIAGETSDELVIVMRTYFEKPRTRGGWKGFLDDPDLDGRCDLVRGIEQARRLLLAINELGVPCACEFLEPLAAPYLEDLVSWGAIGARTSESQVHRALASRLPMPIGFKNGIDGRIEVATNGVRVARESHSTLGFDAHGLPAVIRSAGNRDGHIVLRGGGGRPNHDARSVEEAFGLAREGGLSRPVVVDCSHENSGREPGRQAPVARDVIAQLVGGQHAIAGLMIESNLRGGAQSWSPGAHFTPGVSLTDPCIDWDETAALLREICDTLRAQRR